MNLPCSDTLLPELPTSSDMQFDLPTLSGIECVNLKELHLPPIEMKGNGFLSGANTNIEQKMKVLQLLTTVKMPLLKMGWFLRIHSPCLNF